MYRNIIRPRCSVIFALPIALLVPALGLSGGLSAPARAGDASLDFAGHLISGFQDFPWDMLDPAYPRCF